MPIAVIITWLELDILGEQALGHYTHEKNLVTCRAALSTIEVIEDEGLVENVRVIGAHALDRIHDMAAHYSLIGNVGGLCLLMDVDLVLDRKAKTPTNDTAEAVMYAAFEKGPNF